jgi:hypothetical protein
LRRRIANARNAQRHVIDLLDLHPSVPGLLRNGGERLCDI